MTRLKLKYVNVVRKKNGTAFYYLRRAGFERAPLPGIPRSAGFNAAYAAALERSKTKKIEIASDRTIPGTVNAAIAGFYQSHAFTKNKPITQQTDRNILEAFRAKHGNKRIALMETRHVEAALAEKAGRPAAQHNLLRVLRVLMNFAIKEGLRKDNPTIAIPLKAPKSTGYHSWTEDELRAFEARHPIGTKARLALGLLLYTAQRRGDIVRLGPPNMRDGWLRFTQSKTGTAMEI